MAPVGMKVLALEVRVGDDEAYEFFRFLPLAHESSFRIAQIGANSFSIFKTRSETCVLLGTEDMAKQRSMSH